MEIEAYVPATDDAMPVRVEFAPRAVGILWPASAEGTANEWITLRTTFSPGRESPSDGRRSTSVRCRPRSASASGP